MNAHPRVCAECPGVFLQPFDQLFAGLVQEHRLLMDLAANKRPEGGHDIPPKPAAPHDEAQVTPMVLVII